MRAGHNLRQLGCVNAQLRKEPEILIQCRLHHFGRYGARGLGVREVWIWKKEELNAYELRGGAYAEIPESVVILGLTPSFIREFLDCETQTEAVRKLRAALRK